MERVTAADLGKAEQEINRILHQLEVDTGQIVDSIGLSDIDVTTIDDDRPQWLRCVRIELKRLPGTRWPEVVVAGNKFA